MAAVLVQHGSNFSSVTIPTPGAAWAWSVFGGCVHCSSFEPVEPVARLCARQDIALEHSSQSPPDFCTLESTFLKEFDGGALLKPFLQRGERGQGQE